MSRPGTPAPPSLKKSLAILLRVRRELLRLRPSHNPVATLVSLGQTVHHLEWGIENLVDSGHGFDPKDLVTVDNFSLGAAEADAE